MPDHSRVLCSRKKCPAPPPVRSPRTARPERVPRADTSEYIQRENKEPQCARSKRYVGRPARFGIGGTSRPPILYRSERRLEIGSPCARKRLRHPDAAAIALAKDADPGDCLGGVLDHSPAWTDAPGGNRRRAQRHPDSRRGRAGNRGVLASLHSLGRLDLAADRKS